MHLYHACALWPTLQICKYLLSKAVFEIIILEKFTENDDFDQLLSLRYRQ